MTVAIVVEDGTGRADANSYASAVSADTYFANILNVNWLGSLSDKSAALIRASAYIDARYRSRYPGYRTQGRLQGLEWPRIGAYTIDNDNGRSEGFYNGGYYRAGYYYIAPNVVPREILTATFEGAVRELAKPGVLAPDLKRGGQIREVHAGSVGISYSVAASPNTVFQALDYALASLLIAGSQYSGMVALG
jgi:hypothetical protein